MLAALLLFALQSGPPLIVHPAPELPSFTRMIDAMSVWRDCQLEFARRWAKQPGDAGTIADGAAGQCASIEPKLHEYIVIAMNEKGLAAYANDNATKMINDRRSSIHRELIAAILAAREGAPAKPSPQK